MKSSVHWTIAANRTEYTAMRASARRRVETVIISSCDNSGLKQCEPEHTQNEQTAVQGTESLTLLARAQLQRGRIRPLVADDQRVCVRRLDAPFLVDVAGDARDQERCGLVRRGIQRSQESSLVLLE